MPKNKVVHARDSAFFSKRALPTSKTTSLYASATLHACVCEGRSRKRKQAKQSQGPAKQTSKARPGTSKARYVYTNLSSVQG